MTSVVIDLPVLQSPREFSDRIDQRPCHGCDACGMRCTTGVQMLESEFHAIVEELARLPSSEREHVLTQEKNTTVPGTQYAYTACRFRDVERGRCLIYPARPLICRLFGHVEWLPCPIDKVPAPAPGGLQVMQAYARQDLRTYEQWLEAEGDDRS